MASDSPAPQSFESLFKRLEETVAKLETGGMTLEESLALYEEGAKLAQQCQTLLKNANQRITKLQESFTDGMSGAREEPPDYNASTTEDVQAE
jgi:exodeoxyribonuclease VII small subunit